MFGKYPFSFLNVSLTFGLFGHTSVNSLWCQTGNEATEMRSPIVCDHLALCEILQSYLELSDQ